MIGSAAFLLPDGLIVPESFFPPSTMYCRAPMGAKVDGTQGQRQARSMAVAAGLSLAHLVKR